MIRFFTTSILLVPLLYPVASHSQTAQAGNPSSSNTLVFNVDHAQFRYPPDRLFVEIYFSFPRAQFQTVETDSLKLVRFSVEAEIFQDDTLVALSSWNGQSAFVEASDKQDKELFTLTNFQLPAGKYLVKTRIKDWSSPSQGRKEFPLILQPFSNERLDISDIELAYSITSDTSKNIYTKNHYRVIPNPGALVDAARPILYFYSELYNLSTGENAAYTVEYAILNDQQVRVKSFPPNTRATKAGALVEVGGFNLITLASGAYFLEITVTDNSQQSLAKRRKKFFVFKANRPQRAAAASALDFSSSPLMKFYQTLSAPELEQEFDSVRYIATKEEKKMFDRLQPDGKRTFLVQFWSKRDPVPETTHNEFRSDYLERVKFADARFGGFKKGWQTDRGRVLILYGLPDEIDRHPSIGKQRGYETWHYYMTELEMRFVFVDKTGMQELELVHSTARGEVYDPDWQRWIEVQ
ncbi:MAG: GWxTD domain-containing protein [bacterium]